MAIARLIESKKNLGFKVEGTAYTAETLAAADYDFSVYDIQVSPEIESYARKLARGDFSHDNSVSGRRKFVASWKVDLHSGAAAATAPKYFDMLRSCGLKQITYGATGVQTITDSEYGNVPATVEIALPQEGTSPKQLIIKGRGCMGNARFVLSQTGQPIVAEFEFQGALDGVTTRSYANLITPTAFDTNTPPAVLSATISLFGTTQCIRGMTIDLGNDVQSFTCPEASSGYQGAHVVARRPTLEMDPDTLVTDDLDWYTNHITDTTGALSVTIGSNLLLYAPAAQLTQSYNLGEAEGHSVNPLQLELQRSNGNDEFYLLQGSTS